MSKSEVNLVKNFRISKLKSETAIKTLKSSIDKGKKLNHERCLMESQTFSAATFKTKKPKPTNLFICKLIYPDENAYPACDHQNDIVIDRNMFTRNEHLNLLSTPKKFYQKPYPKWVRKNIPSCTAHLNELSQPKKINLVTTLNDHRYHLKFNQIENLFKRILFGKHQTPQDVLQSLRQQLRDDRCKIKQQKCEIKKLRMKIAKSKQFEDMSALFIAKLKRMLICDHPINMNETTRKVANEILPKLCQMTGHKVPNKNSSNSIDKAHIKLANKFAVCIQHYLKNTCFKNQQSEIDESECLRRFKNICFPIDGYYPQKFKTKEIEDEEQSEKSHDDTNSDAEIDSGENLSLNDEKNSVNENIVTAKHSFLSPSKVNVTIDDCQEIWSAVNDVTGVLAEKKALKEKTRGERAEREKILAQEKAEREVERLKQEKAEAKARRKARRRKGKNNCFGNTNPKPQWQVEWKETETSDLCKTSYSP